jgi:hypothetical protein
MLAVRRISRILLFLGLASTLLAGLLSRAMEASAATAAHDCGVRCPGYKTIGEEGHEPPVYDLKGTLLMGYFNERKEREPASAFVPVTEMDMGTGTFKARATFEGSEAILGGTETGTSLVIKNELHQWYADFSDLCIQPNGHVGGEGTSFPDPDHVPGY